jgi:hypothetical protein
MAGIVELSWPLTVAPVQRFEPVDSRALAAPASRKLALRID